MTLNGFPSTCGGSNTTCFRCFGTGVAAGSAPASAAGPFIKGQVSIVACGDVTHAIETALERRDRLDASKDYYICHENGRLGSHPLHDAFDDESWPR